MEFQNTADIQKELGCKVFSIFRNQIGRRTEVEYPMGNKFNGDRARGYVLQGNIFHQLGELIYDNQKVSVTAWRAHLGSTYGDITIVG